MTLDDIVAFLIDWNGTAMIHSLLRAGLDEAVIPFAEGNVVAALNASTAENSPSMSG